MVNAILKRKADTTFSPTTEKQILVATLVPNAWLRTLVSKGPKNQNKK